jgi:hypothetical protein
VAEGEGAVASRTNQKRARLAEKSMERGDWIRFNERDDVIASTNLLALVAPTLKTTPTNWKWMILAAHSGLQGALVCAIKDSTGTNVLTKKSAEATLAWLENPTGVYPAPYLEHYPTLSKKYRKKYPDCSITLQQLKDLKKLHSEFRNQFTHFAPMQWSIEEAGLPRITKAALDLIEESMQRHQVEIHLTCDMKRNLAENLQTIT